MFNSAFLNVVHSGEIDSYEPKYLTQTVWKFHSLLEKWHLYSLHLRVHLAICHVDAAARSYHESRALSAFVPMFSRFNVNRGNV